VAQKARIVGVGVGHGAHMALGLWRKNILEL